MAVFLKKKKKKKRERKPKPLEITKSKLNLFTEKYGVTLAFNQ